MTMPIPQIKSFFHSPTCTFSYIVSDPNSRHCVIIDPVLDYDHKSGRITTRSAQALLDFIKTEQLKPEWVLETHVHADHLSAASWLRAQIGGRIGIGGQVKTVQSIFKQLFNTEPEFMTDGSQFDQLLQDGDILPIGELNVRVMHTPGHTPVCLTYIVGDAAFVGDTIFMPDVGTARTDFPGGDAETLYQSIQKIYALPPQTRLFMCHDYAQDGRDYECHTTVATECSKNIHIRDDTDIQAFVTMRQARDRASDAPVLLFPSVQVNMRAGQLPPAENNGKSYLKIPINSF